MTIGKEIQQETLNALSVYKDELENEWLAILDYWMKYTIDEVHGGFYGSVDNNNQPLPGAPKGVVLHARILWSFSVAYQYFNKEEMLVIAGRAYDYIINHFIDKTYGGVYWSVDENGAMLEGRKQIYGLAFCIYGLSEYYAATKNKQVLDEAIVLYRLIEKHSLDTVNKGYLEAFSREWGSLDDLRLSSKDANEKKTMNTHLHIVEAYAALYKVWPNNVLQLKIADLLELIDKHFINHQTHHLRLFFDENWNEKIDVVSYGHDIEAAWLLLQCAEIIGDEKGIEIFQQHAVSLTHAAMRGFDDDGGIWYEFEQQTNHLIKEKHSWPQAEAMIGFMNAYQVSGKEDFLHQSIKSWQFVKNKILDKQNGEWFWGVSEDDTVMKGYDKAGFWKCPYHNSRACMEIIKRIGNVI